MSRLQETIQQQQQSTFTFAQDTQFEITGQYVAAYSVNENKIQFSFQSSLLMGKTATGQCRLSITLLTTPMKLVSRSTFV